MNKSLFKYAGVLALMASWQVNLLATPLRGRACYMSFNDGTKIKSVRYSAPGISESRLDHSNVEFERMISKTRVILEQQGRTPESVLKDLAQSKPVLKEEIDQTLALVRQLNLNLQWASSKSTVDHFDSHTKIVYVNPVDALDPGVGAREILINLQAPLRQANLRFKYEQGMTKEDFIEANVMQVGLAVVDGYIAEAHLTHKLIAEGDLKLSDIDPEHLPVYKIIESGGDIEHQRAHLLTILGSTPVLETGVLSYTLWQEAVAEAWDDIPKN